MLWRRRRSAGLGWLKGQRIAEYGREHYKRYYWLTAVAFGAMLASKYLPHFMAISGSYYYIFQGIPQTRWRMGKKKKLMPRCFGASQSVRAMSRA